MMRAFFSPHALAERYHHRTGNRLVGFPSQCFQVPHACATSTAATGMLSTLQNWQRACHWPSVNGWRSGAEVTGELGVCAAIRRPSGPRIGGPHSRSGVARRSQRTRRSPRGFARSRTSASEPSRTFRIDNRSDIAPVYAMRLRLRAPPRLRAPGWSRNQPPGAPERAPGSRRNQPPSAVGTGPGTGRNTQHHADLFQKRAKAAPSDSGRTLDR
jgi:hypothetical protein